MYKQTHMNTPQKTHTSFSYINNLRQSLTVLNTKRFSTPRNTETAEYTNPRMGPRNTAQHTAQHGAKLAKRLCNFVIGYRRRATSAHTRFF